MNERDLFAAVNAIADPAERMALLERECASRPELRRRIERLVDVPLGPEAFLETPAVGLTVTRSKPDASAAPKPSRGSPDAASLDALFAEPATFSLTVRAFLFRYRVLVVAGAAAFITLFVGAAWGVSALLDAERRRAFADAEAAGARTAAAFLQNLEHRERRHAEARSNAEDDRRHAVRLMDATLAALRAATTKALKLIDDRRQLTAREKEYFESLARQWETLAEASPVDAGSVRRCIDSRLRAADLWRVVGRPDAAVAGLRASLTTLADLPEVGVSTDDRRTLAAIHAKLGSILAEQGKRKDALGEYRAAADQHAWLTKEFPTDTDHANGLADALFCLGALLADLDRRDESQTVFNEAIDVQTVIVDRHPDRADLEETLARLHGGLGVALHQFGRRDEAITAYERSCRLRQKTADRHPLAIERQEALAKARSNFAILLDESGETDKAIAECRQALDIRKALANRQPERLDLRRNLADSHAQLGDLIDRLGKTEEALREHQAALQILEKLAVEHPADNTLQEDLGHAHVGVGKLFVRIKRLQEALGRFLSARDLRRSILVQFPNRAALQRDLAEIHRDLFHVYRRLGRANEARSECRSALAIRETLVDRFSDDVECRVELAKALYDSASLLMEDGKAAESVQEFSRAVEWLDRPSAETSGRAGDEQLKQCLWGRAQAYAILGKCNRALRDADRVVALSPEAERPAILASRANLRLKAGDAAGAVADADELTRTGTWSGRQWYNFACVYAAASAQLPTRRDACARRAIELLDMAAQAGYRNIAHARRDPDLQPLSNDAGFKKWLEKLDAALRESPSDAQ
jgi:tetratricopeptide (TPR) repeat protein